MRRPAICTMLAGALLTQGLPWHHGHGPGEEPAHHDARPHVHLHRHAAEAHEHAHHVDHGPVEHEHVAHEPSRKSAGERNGPLFGHAHDDDAVYVVIFAGAKVNEGRSDTGNPNGMDGPVADCGRLVSIELPPPEPVAEPPPPALRNNLPLYLRTLSLRI